MPDLLNSSPTSTADQDTIFDRLDQRTMCRGRSPRRRAALAPCSSTSASSRTWRATTATRISPELVGARGRLPELRADRARLSRLERERRPSAARHRARPEPDRRRLQHAAAQSGAVAVDLARGALRRARRLLRSRGAARGRAARRPRRGVPLRAARAARAGAARVAVGRAHDLLDDVRSHEPAPLFDRQVVAGRARQTHGDREQHRGADRGLGYAAQRLSRCALRGRADAGHPAPALGPREGGAALAELDGQTGLSKVCRGVTRGRGRRRSSRTSSRRKPAKPRDARPGA